MTDNSIIDVLTAFEKVDSAPYRYEPVTGTRQWIEANRHLLDGSRPARIRWKEPLATPLPNIKVVDGLPDDLILFASPRVDEECRQHLCDHTHVVAVRVEDR